MPEKNSSVKTGKLLRAVSKEHFDDARGLFREYADGLEIDLCFQNFETELKNPELVYAEPWGCIILYYAGDTAAGCAALKKHTEKVCEMKRLYVRQKYRGKKIGEYLAIDIIRRAREKGYRKMKLDTLGRMTAARTLYKKLGFVTTKPYRYNPEEDVIYMEKIL